MTVVHIVLFEFKPSASRSAVQDICARMLALKDICLHPATQKPYITSTSGGRDMSIENKQGGFTHGFVVHFKSTADRDYYVLQDPVHLAFKERANEVVETVQVVDFVPGEF